MTAPELTIGANRLADLPRLPRDDGGPVFAEPWQAQAFALAVRLSEQGHYTWKEWASALAAQLQTAADRGEPDDGSRYYEHWLAALESLVVAKGLADRPALDSRKEAWAAAYRDTPHGQPIVLQARAVDPRWLLGGVAGTFLTYWVFQQLNWQSTAEPSVAAGLSATAGFGAVLGMRHALEPDHLAAVSTLMTGERSSAKAAWLGAWWGLGHTLTLLVTGGLLLLLQTEMPEMTVRAFELCVVLLLVAFGARAIHHAARRVPRAAAHSHRAPRASSILGLDNWTVARPLLVGAVHGLAGSGALTAMVVTALPSATMQLGYLLLFGAGSTVGMAALSGLLGWPIARLGANHAFTRSFSLAVGCISGALGLLWGYPIIRDTL